MLSAYDRGREKVVAERHEHFVVKASEKLICEEVRKRLTSLAEIYCKLALNKWQMK